MGSLHTITEQDFATAEQTEAIKQAGSVEAKRHMLQTELERGQLEKPDKRY